MRAILIGVAGFFLIAIMLQVCALNEVRSNIYNISQKKVSLDGASFSGFYYDIDDNTGTEVLTLRLVDIASNGTSAILSDQHDSDGNRGIVYTTKAQPTDFDYSQWGQYEMIKFLGESYFAAYGNTPMGSETYQLIPFLYDISKDRNLMADELISKILIDTNDDQIISLKEPLKLEEGYELSVKAINVKGKKIHVVLSKDGEVIDTKIIQQSMDESNIGDETYYYKKDIMDTKDIVILAVHFEDIFSGSGIESARVDGIFQISDTPISIKEGTEYGKMSISEINLTSMAIKIDNKDQKIRLSNDMEIELMPDIYIYTADQDDISSTNPLRYYVYKG
jgi:S-layer protein (TIGR01567 family)